MVTKHYLGPQVGLEPLLHQTIGGYESSTYWPCIQQWIHPTVNATVGWNSWKKKRKVFQENKTLLLLLFRILMWGFFPNHLLKVVWKNQHLDYIIILLSTCMCYSCLLLLLQLELFKWCSFYYLVKLFVYDFVVSVYRVMTDCIHKCL